MQRQAGTGLLGFGIVLAAVGAIMRFAVTASSKDVSIHKVGVILLIVGIVMAVIGLAVAVAGGRSRSVVREDIRDVPGGTQRTVQRDDILP